MQSFIFATNNKNKVEEVRLVLHDLIHILSLQEAGINIDIPEPHDSLEKNASEKSHAIFNLTRTNCFSEDTGLEVTALNGEPGVRSARYAGNGNDVKKNISKLLYNLRGEKNRRAQFRTIISLMMNGEEFQFEGICKGEITYKETGTNGFGYDPVFKPEGSSKNFGEMTLEEKNNYSHRKKAIDKLIEFVKAQHGQDKN